MLRRPAGHALQGFPQHLRRLQVLERTPAELTSRLINVKEFVDYVKAVKGGNEDKIIVSSIIGWTPIHTPYGMFETGPPSSAASSWI